MQMWKASYALLEEVKAEQMLRIRLFDALVRENRANDSFLDQFRHMLCRRRKRIETVRLDKDKERAQEEVEVLVEVECEIEEAMTLRERMAGVLVEFIDDVIPLGLREDTAAVFIKLF